jgi:ATP-dependent DNA helicase RecQ
MAGHDPVAQGRVQLLDAPAGDIAQAMAALDELTRLSMLDPDFRWDRCAIIAREWRRLEPVRSYAESRDIPVELANEHLPSIWRLREMQILVSSLRSVRGELITIKDLIALLNRQTPNRWTDLLAEGIAAMARELGTGAMPALDVIEWLAEWSRDTRGEQRGLLLLTGHRAKGLEFDHVVLLDGGWEHKSRGEDAEAPRRLFYVSMTRARKTLAATMAGAHRFLQDRDDIVLRRQVSVDLRHAAPAPRHYQLPSLEVVDLSYAGRLSPSHPAHDAIASAQVGDELRLADEGDRWMLYDQNNRPLGRMARSWQPPEGMVFLRGTVGAVVRWRKSDNDELYQQWIKREEWETVLPELEFHTGLR